MMYLITKIVLFLVASFALGFAVAWFTWRATAARREREITSRWERRLGDLQRERDTSMAKLRREVEDHRQQIPTLEASLADRSDLIARLEGDLSDWRAKLPELEARLRERDERESELLGDLEARDASIEALRDELATSESQRAADEAAARARHDTAAETSAGLRDSKEAAQRRTQELNVEIQRLHAVAEAAKNEREDARRHLRDARGRLEQLETARADLAARLAAAEQGATADLFGSRQIGTPPAGLLGEAPSPGVADDLKQIRGVGPVLERTLNGLGIYFFEQLAALDENELEWVAHHLNTFPGRIARDRWVEQAARLHATKQDAAR